MSVLITGAAGSIGSAVARAWRARRPTDTLVLADLEAPEALAAELGARAMAWDLRDLPAIGPRLDEAQVRHGPVDTLVNCAGIMDLVTLAATDSARARAILDVDLRAPMALMARVAPSMAERGAGTIVNVSSLAGVVPLRGSAWYGAAKSGLAMASEVAHLELAPRGVHVLTVYPGPVHSALEQRARSHVPPSGVATWLPTGDPEVLARRILRALDRRAPRVIYPRRYTVAWWAPRLAGLVTAKLSPSPLR